MIWERTIPFVQRCEHANLPFVNTSLSIIGENANWLLTSVNNLAAQEFYSLLLEIDKQIDAAFQRRLRANRKRKKSHGENDDLAATPSADTVRLVENREKLVEAFKQVFPDLYHVLLPPPTKIIDPEMEKKVLEQAKKDGRFLPLPQLPGSLGNGYKPTFNSK